MKAWLLLSESRGRVLRTWNIFSAVVVAFVLIQTVTGKLAGIEGLAWLWATAVLVPGMVMLNTHAWLNKAPAKIIHPGAHRAMLALAATYLTLILATLLFSQAAIQQNDYGLDTWFKRSLFLLLFLQSLVLLSFWLLFFKRESLFRPNPRIILDIVNAKAEQASRQGNDLRRKCLEMVASNNIDGTFDFLKAHFEKNNQGNLETTLVLSGQYTTLLRETQLNTVDPAQAQRNLNRVTLALLELAEDIRE